MNYRIVLNILGRILLLEAGLLLLPLVVAALYGESILPFAWTILLAAAAAAVLLLVSRKRSGSLHTREGFVSVALSWIVISLFGALPFLFSGVIPNFIDALFEIVSGFTTTGATILPEVESLPRGILFWRSFSIFIGGMGVLVFMMAILPMDEEHSMHLLRAEVPGPVKGKLVPRMRRTARILYIIYIAMTVLETVLLLCGGMPLYDAVVTAFATAGTGGFSVRNASIGAYGSAYIEMVVAVFMVAFGVNFNLYYIVLVKRSLRGFKSQELWCYLGVVLLGTVTIALNIAAQCGGLLQALRYSFFHVASVITTTGYSTADFAQWPTYSRMFLVLLMICGGCAGSTAGGVKVSRFLIVIKSSGREIRHMLFPRSVTHVTLDREPLEGTTVRSTLAYMMLYAMIVMAASLLLSLQGLDLETTVSSAITCLSNVGPGLSMAGPIGNFAIWNGASKLLLCLCMLLGRLEIFPVIMLFAPGVWVGQKK